MESLSADTNLLPISEIVDRARSRGYVFGFANPYNRLRYYIKVGLLPHMVRRSVKDETTEGHLPETTVETLVTIQKLKKDGYRKEEILNLLTNQKMLVRTETTPLQMRPDSSPHELFRNVFLIRAEFTSAITQLNVSNNRNPLWLIIGALLLIIVTLSLNNLNLLGTSVPPPAAGETKRTAANQLNPENLAKPVVEAQTAAITAPNTITPSRVGSGTLSTGQTSVTIKSEQVTPNSKIFLAATSLSGGQPLIVARKVGGQYFVVEIENPLKKDVTFDWWVVD